MERDAIVVGAGHNGLICAAYLAKAGLDTLLLEARTSVGGCASTVDALGARVNICSCDHSVFRTTPVIDELDLGRHGLRYLDVDPAVWNLTYGHGPAWPLFHDVERTADALRLTHPREADGYRRYAAAARPVAELVLEMANEPPTVGRVVRTLSSRRADGLATLLRWSRRSAAEVLQSFFTSEALVAPAFAAGPAVWGLAPSTPRTGLGALTYALKHIGQVGRPEGGSGSVPAAVLASFEAAGGAVRTATRVAAILCEGSRVRGVSTADGAVVEAPVVIVACDPQVALVRWLRDPPGAARSMVERWRAAAAREGYESKIDAVISALPVYRGAVPGLAERLGVDPLQATTVIAPTLAGLEEAHGCLGAGRVADRPMFLVNVPSVLDPTVAVPGGGHVFSLETLYTPYGLVGGWSGSNEPARWLDVYAGLVEPGFREGIERWRVMTPVSYEEEFFLPRGYATSFAGGPVAALVGRQRELTRYETPVKGLYLTGAATFPGAGVWGASGRNTATVVLAKTP
jgi:phytoene dehydrogenase-like protein